jgi:hypothetical protein
MHRSVALVPSLTLQPYDIRQIDFGFNPGYGHLIRSYDLTIRQDTVLMQMEDSVDPADRVDSICVLDLATSQKLYGILHQTGITELKDSFDYPGFDAGINYLRIEYGNGKEKDIRDYGGEGTYTLMAFYRIMDQIVATQHWTCQFCRTAAAAAVPLRSISPGPMAIPSPMTWREEVSMSTS